MTNQPHTTTHPPIGRDDLDMAQDDIQMTQEALHDTLERMKEALDAGTPIDPKLFQESMEHIEELEVEANNLRHGLKTLQQQPLHTASSLRHGTPPGHG